MQKQWRCPILRAAQLAALIFNHGVDLPGFASYPLLESEELDEGDPEELGELVGALRKKFPHFTVVGGCCGTDLRHLRRIVEQAHTASA